jgi:hypothetical protein
VEDFFVGRDGGEGAECGGEEEEGLHGGGRLGLCGGLIVGLSCRCC